MQKVKRLLFLVLGLFCIQSTDSLIIRGEIWRKKRDDGSYYYVYGGYDIHLSNLMQDPSKSSKIRLNDLPSVAREQYLSLVINIQKIPSNDRVVLVEDSYTYRDGQPAIPAGLRTFVDSLSGTEDVLFELSQRLNRDNIAPVNIDYRQKRVIANFYDSLMFTALLNVETLKKISSISDPLARSLNSLVEFQIRLMQRDGLTGTNILQYDGALNFKMKDIMEDLDAEINKILKYEDGKTLYHYYRDQISRIRAQGKIFYEKMQAAKEQKYRRFAISFGEKIGEFGGGFMAYAGALLDLNALHEITQNERTKKKTILIAGGGHVGKVFLMLPKLGYEPVYETGVSAADINIMTKTLEQMYDINSFLKMSMQDFVNKITQGTSKSDDLCLSIIKQKNWVHPRFFDLVGAVDPEKVLEKAMV